ncbi:hypothetical protein WDD9_001958 [Paenibacillus melissococcoides]|uniref:hypothetical protein n=1 Tax=Paenibacillus melissococcoides TaxID=2912268 RepID=UPI001B123A9A|nr:hypothetical protein [Paenibacillus melissococcoides]GIO77415.1 hypothetical protein J6TS7_10250 [Paenibacillus dendritiformis]CAH8708582.1 hypothetical protein WDD9_001958 [Paenibacillus melissococcoides]CAH8709299.1 hypothetical protein HTL2_002244 [Paenibacillus melissococcoides]
MRPEAMKAARRISMYRDYRVRQYMDRYVPDRSRSLQETQPAEDDPRAAMAWRRGLAPKLG